MKKENNTMKNEKETISLSDEQLKKVTGGKEFFKSSDETDGVNVGINFIAYIEDNSK